MSVTISASLVKELRDATGAELTRVRELNLWEGTEGYRPSITSALDPGDFGIDPLVYL